MKPKLTLALAGTQLLAEVVKPAAKAGLHGLLRSLPFAGGQASASAPGQVVARATVPGATVGDLRARLDEAMSHLRAGHDGRVGGLALEVQLGLEHARIGLMVLQDVAATALSNATRETYAQAWVRQMLHLDPATQVVRWQVLADAHRLLISCVDRAVFEVLRDFAAEYRLRFVSCRPAVLSAMDAQQEAMAAGGLTVVWTEAGVDAARAHSVQLLRFEGTALAGMWRGWVPPTPGANGKDPALEGAVHRFQAHHRAAAGGALKHLHWPSVAQDAASVQ